MKFSSCESILNNFLFLVKVIKELDDNYFEFLNKQQITQEKQAIIRELELDTIFKLLSKLESEIKQDYNDAIAKKKKDALSKKYLLLCQQFRTRIQEYKKPLESVCQKVSLDDILDEIKVFFKDTHPDFSRNISILKGYFKFRHWYAHGRYFQRTPPIPPFQQIHEICNEFNAYVF
ncbi:hypothetical protein BGP_4588 [Beggiatoa sp. PS]|nr:hypothetical protein BGP_4588 [Beggiatoa sp. PS]